MKNQNLADPRPFFISMVVRVMMHYKSAAAKSVSLELVFYSG